MNQPHKQCSLYLHPAQAVFQQEDFSALVLALQNTGFIAKKMPSVEGEDTRKKTQQHYFTGDNFLNYIAYMGCAPNIQFEANASSQAFCHIKIHQYKHPKLIYSKAQLRAPQCPQCKKVVNNWLQNINASSLHCDNCDSQSNIEDFHWRKMAGYAQLFIEITDIFPGEAIPQPSLLNALQRITNTSWLHFYSCH